MLIANFYSYVSPSCDDIALRFALTGPSVATATMRCVRIAYSDTATQQQQKHETYFLHREASFDLSSCVAFACVACTAANLYEYITNLHIYIVVCTCINKTSKTDDIGNETICDAM